MNGTPNQRLTRPPEPTRDFHPEITPPPGETTVSDVDGMTLVYIPAGEFLMGSSDTDPAAENDERPQHLVYLDSFWIDQTEVTNGMYNMCVQAGLCDPPEQFGSEARSDYFSNPEYDNYPVIFVSWDDADTYCNWAGRRLPTESEWEKAARGTDRRFYPWGLEIDCTRANYMNESGLCIGETTKVGSYPQGASPYGVLDMAGNVWEWVNDWYKEDYYIDSPLENPMGPTSGSSRVVRGGWWKNSLSRLRSANRGYNNPLSADSNRGFRCARSAE
jgi:formylglycine-generating enzyme required for sulfatase activity